MLPVHAQLFSHAVRSLKEYNEQSERNKDVVLVKDAQVAMSCVLNVMSERVRKHFSQTDEKDLISDAKSSCLLADFDSHTCTAFLRKYLDILKEKGIVYLKRLVTMDRGDLYRKYLDEDPLPVNAMVEEKVLRILELLCEFIIHPPFLKASPSENDCLQVWKSVFGVIADKVSLHTGEKALKASRIMKQIQSSEYSDVSESGRKVDCLFMVENHELSNIEFKSPEIGKRELAIQNRKNVRLARCIQESHISLGEKDASILMADVCGFVGVFYQVKQMDSISVAGKTTETLVQIPQTAAQLEDFLADTSLAVICNYMVSVRTLDILSFVSLQYFMVF
ncbi:unnamed protein product [Umbelopsis ramanniana]